MALSGPASHTRVSLMNTATAIPGASRAVELMHRRHFSHHDFQPAAVIDALDRLDQERAGIMADAISPAQREQRQPAGEGKPESFIPAMSGAPGVDTAGLEARLEAIERQRRATLLSLPPHISLERLPSDPLPELQPAPAPYQLWDHLSSDRRGDFVRFNEAPLGDLASHSIGSTLEASTLGGTDPEFGQIQHARESGLLYNFPLGIIPGRLMVRVRLRLKLGFHHAVFFDRWPSEVYTSIFEYHLPFVTAHAGGLPGLFTEIGARPFPGLHGVEWFRSRLAEGGQTTSRNPTDAESAWDFSTITELHFVTPGQVQPGPDGVCIAVGVRQMVQVLAQQSQFEVKAGGVWEVVDVRAGII